MFTPDMFNELGAGHLPGHLGIEITETVPERVRGRIALAPYHLAPNGYLHAGTVITLADTLCGYATVVNLPEGATGFTTIELKTNFLGTLLDGVLEAEARPVHRGRTTQVWDAEVRAEDKEKLLALFRCTQMILFPKK